MAEKSESLVVIGGGGAGIIAAWRAAERGARVTLLERNKKLGIKLLISGGGKCNITHAGPMEELRSAFVRHEARFLKPAFHRFSNNDIVGMIEAHGVGTSTRPDGRIFPLNGDADDVVHALVSYLNQENITVRLNTKADSIVVEGGRISGISAGGQLFPSPLVIMATGGASYPRTGTTGDGYRMARSVGHTLVPLRPALAPIAVAPPFPTQWRGIALRGGYLSVHARGRKLAGMQDDLLFSHEGLSGPAALELSRPAAEALEHGTVFLQYDFFPEKEFGGLDKDLAERIVTQRGKTIASILEPLLPNRMIPTLLGSVGIDPARRGHVLTREERRAVTGLLKSWHIGNVTHIPIERGEVTAGGVLLTEVDPHTMQSRKLPGLYLCGEVLDIAGPIGGYNLQAAFSTGFVAGESAADNWFSTHGITRARKVPNSLPVPQP